MAVNDLLSKLSNLELGDDNGETERSSTFWNPVLLSMKFNLEPAWLHATWNAKIKPNFGMRNMDAILGERCCLKLEISGPLIDSYLKEIGRAFWAKLGPSKCTGLMVAIKIFIPYNIFRMCAVYVLDMVLTSHVNKENPRILC